VLTGQDGGGPANSGRNRRVKTCRPGGRGGTQMPHAARGGGFGVVGLTERVSALGGEIHAGPRPDGGWEVVALLPTTR
jgi:signal transduction histidine kinase